MALLMAESSFSASRHSSAFWRALVAILSSWSFPKWDLKCPAAWTNFELPQDYLEEKGGSLHYGGAFFGAYVIPVYTVGLPIWSAWPTPLSEVLDSWDRLEFQTCKCRINVDWGRCVLFRAEREWRVVCDQAQWLAWYTFLIGQYCQWT